MMNRSITHKDINAAQRWQREMAAAAYEFGVTMQHCMALPREILQTAQAQGMARARTSGDYMLSRLTVFCPILPYSSYNSITLLTKYWCCH